MVLFLLFIIRTRGTATGLTAALSYVLSFISAKTFYSLETTLSMPGVALFNCIVSAIGIVLMYNILPETENRTLEDIELHFADSSKRITDRQIARINQPQMIECGKDNIEIPTMPALMMPIDEPHKKTNVYNSGCDNRAFSRDS